ncbi:MAG: hypothetical protein R2734_06995 [Nocardioides sp.]
MGFLDDYIKVYRQHNQGLRSGAKMAGQMVVALVFAVLATCFFADDRGVRPASQHLSGTHDWGVRLPLVVVLVLIWFIVTATSNGANLTDGADGLLTGTAAMVFGAYTLVNIWQNNQLCGSTRPTVVESQCYQVRDPLDLAVFAAAIAGACIGFLWWNANPARIIMGDVGSLALGGALAGLAIMSRTELLMAVIAGVRPGDDVGAAPGGVLQAHSAADRHWPPAVPHRAGPSPLRAPRVGRGQRGDPVLGDRRCPGRGRAGRLLRRLADLRTGAGALLVGPGGQRSAGPDPLPGCRSVVRGPAVGAEYSPIQVSFHTRST